VANKPIVGVDVSMEWLDLCWDDRTERIANEATAIAAFLDRVAPGIVACEPTGGYERALTRAVRERGIVFVRVHPNAVIAYRKSRGVRAKSDRIDARLIRDYVLDVVLRYGVRAHVFGNDRLRELAARRRQLIQSVQAERCRLSLAELAIVRDNIGAVIALLQTGLEAIEREIAARIAADPELSELSRLLQTITGIGPVVAAIMLTGLPELGVLSGKQIGALVGLAPNTRQSGKSHYREPTGHGRPDVLQALFNAARAAIRHPSPFKEFYDRLVVHNGRPGPVALVAVMRKILVTANAVARDRKPWRAHDRTQQAVGTQGRRHAKPTAQRQGRVKAAAAQRAVARSASLDAA